MRKYGNRYLIAGIISFQFILCSCKKFIDIGLPNNQIQSKKVFADDSTATSALMGLYSEMMRSTLHLTNGGLSLYAGLSSDEITNTSSSSSIDPITTNSISSDNSIVNGNFWSPAYNKIYTANAILEGLTNSTSLSDSVKNTIEGETKVIRSLYLFYLVNLFGDVPMTLHTNYQTNSIMPRSPSQQVYDQIISDLKDAELILKSNYPSTGRARINKWTASAFLARVYLYRGDWVNAETKAALVINSGIYSLVSNLDNVFVSTSNEIIWQMPPVPSLNNTSEGGSFIPSSTTVKPAYALTPYLINAFEAGDQRKTKWIKSNTISTPAPPTIYSYPYKYKIRTGGAATENNVVMRLSEMYLIRAEARAQQNNIPGSQTDLNIVRTRASLPNTPANNQATLLSAVEHERQTELFTELGHRWLDLKRTNRANAVLGIEKAPYWQSDDALYPIPFAQIERNPFLVQNPGY